MKKFKLLSLFAAGLFLVAVVSGCKTICGNSIATPSAPGTSVTPPVSPTSSNLVPPKQTATTLFPPQYETAGNTALTLVVGVLGILWTYLCKKYNSVQAIADMLEPIIAGVEAGNDKATKKAIQSYAYGAGVQDKFNQKVQAVTNQMPSPSATAVTPAPAPAATSAPAPAPAPKPEPQVKGD